jgi:hypothetical protein
MPSSGGASHDCGMLPAAWQATARTERGLPKDRAPTWRRCVALWRRHAVRWPPLDGQPSKARAHGTLAQHRCSLAALRTDGPIKPQKEDRWRTALLVCAGPLKVLDQWRANIRKAARAFSLKRPNAKVNRRQCEALTSALNDQLAAL